MKIKLLQSMTSCITDGSRSIPIGTEMVKTQTCCSWTYFKGDGFTLIIMGFKKSDGWGLVEVI